MKQNSLADAKLLMVRMHSQYHVLRIVFECDARIFVYRTQLDN